MSVVQSLGKLLKLLTHAKGDGVVSEGAGSFDDVLVPLLLNHLPQLQLQSNLSQARADTWDGRKVFYLNVQTYKCGGQAHPQATNTLSPSHSPMHTINSTATKAQPNVSFPPTRQCISLLVYLMLYNFSLSTKVRAQNTIRLKQHAFRTYPVQSCSPLS